MRWLDGITSSMDMSLSNSRDGKGQGSLVCCSPWGSQRVRPDLLTEQKQEQREWIGDSGECRLEKKADD